MSLDSSSGPTPDNQEYVIPPVEKTRELEFIVDIPEGNTGIYINFEREDSYSSSEANFYVGGYITLERVG
jgi:ribulose bisphosphate carboxylase small subunit